MISYVAQVLNLLPRTVLYSVYIASHIGELIILLITWITSSILRILCGIISFFQIVYEDNVLIFTEEVPNSVNVMVDTVHDEIHGIWKIIATLYVHIYKYLTAILFTVSQLLDAIFCITRDVVLMLMKFTFFMGDTLWLIITFVPVHLPQLVKTVLKYTIDSIVHVVVDSYMALLRLTNFLTEVPLESFLGLTSAIVIVRLYIHFRVKIHTQALLLYWLLVRNFLYLYHSCYDYVTNSETRVISRVASGQELRTRDINFDSENIDNTDINQTDALCVICQERHKCVLTLPCRHVCLCTECCRQLYGYQRTCPICRTFIYHSVTVYL